jgi:tetratricopeptide (TPR) repeat protein
VFLFVRSPLYDDRRYEEALAAADRGLALRPDYPEAYYNRAVALAWLQQYEGALASLRRALELKPELQAAALTTFGTLRQHPTYGPQFRALLGE